MKTTMDASGRLVIPKEIRAKAHITPMTPLEVEFRDGRIEIEPVPLHVRMARKGRLLVAHAGKNLPRLKGDTVEETREQIRTGRSSPK